MPVAAPRLVHGAGPPEAVRLARTGFSLLLDTPAPFRKRTSFQKPTEPPALHAEELTWSV